VTVLFSVDEEQLKMAEHKEDQKAEKPDSVGSEAELIGRIIQSEQKLSEYFTTIITKSVTEQIERRNMARLRMFGIISVVVRTIGRVMNRSGWKPIGSGKVRYTSVI
jgi:hypothetical protein